VLESGRSRSSRSHSPPVRLRTVEGSPTSSQEQMSAAERPVVTRISTNFADGSFGRSARAARDVDVFANATLQLPTEVLRQSTIIVRSPTSASSSPTRSGRGRSLTRAGQGSLSPHRRRSVLPSMSSSGSSSTAQSSEEGMSRSRSRSRSRSPYPYDHSGGEFGRAPDLEFFGHPPVRPRQLQATVSASTDSTLPMGRGHTAFLTHGTREEVMDPRLSPPALPAYGSFPIHRRGPFRSGPKGGRRAFSGHITDLRLFVPVTMGTSPQGPQHSVTLPSRRQYHAPANPVHNPMASNTMDRDTQRTSITVGLSPRMRGSELVTKEDHPPSEYCCPHKYQS
jgi:hypothetical protein